MNDNPMFPNSLPPLNSLPPNLPPPLSEEEQYALLSEPNAASAGEGWAWLTTGWQIIAGNIWKFVGALVIMVLIAVILQLIPKIGSIIYWLISSILTAGFAYMFHQRAEGNPVRVGQFFIGFRKNTLQLVLIALLTGLGLIAIIFIIGFIVIPLVGGASFQLTTLRNPMGFFSWRFMILTLVGLLLYIPLMMAQWISPTLVILHDITAIEAMKLSFKACMKNMLPLLVLGIIVFLIAFVGVIAVGLGMLLMFKSLTLFALFLLFIFVVEILFMLVLMAANYVAYRSVLTNQPLT